MNLKSYNEAKIKLLSGDYSGIDFFKQNGLMLEYGYCLLFSGDYENADIVFKNIAGQDLRADWATKLIQFIKGYVTQVPSYFQIRNFLEIDLYLLMLARQPQFIENIINGADFFYSVNPESYKFIARVMLFNDFIDTALYFLAKAKEFLYNDPEMHYMLATCYVKKREIDKAKRSIKDCLKILPGYFPARNLEKTLTQPNN